MGENTDIVCEWRGENLKNGGQMTGGATPTKKIERRAYDIYKLIAQGAGALDSGEEVDVLLVVLCLNIIANK